MFVCVLVNFPEKSEVLLIKFNHLKAFFFFFFFFIFIFFFYKGPTTPTHSKPPPSHHPPSLRQSNSTFFAVVWKNLENFPTRNWKNCLFNKLSFCFSFFFVSIIRFAFSSHAPSPFWFLLHPSNGGTF